MNSKTLLIDWHDDLVEPWFNSNESGGFLSIVTENNLYNNLEEVGIVAIVNEPAFKKKEVRHKVNEWFKKTVKKFKKESGARLIVFRGCTPQQDILFNGSLLEYAKKVPMDESTLMRIASRFTSHFVNVSEHIHFSEGFFNTYLDDVFEHCKRYSRTATFVESEMLSGEEIEQSAFAFFPSPLTLHVEHLNPNSKYFDAAATVQEYRVSIVTSGEYFMQLLKAAEIKLETPDSSSAQILEYADAELTKKFEAAL